MTDIIETVSAYIDRHQLLPAEGMVVVGVSGGADSLCLLHLLHRLCGAGKRYPDVRLHAAHLDHQLRGEESARDAAAVAALAAAWGLPITTGAVDVQALARTEHRSIEDAARLARYRFLREVARRQGEQERRAGQPMTVIAVAHHADDQVETLVLHWLRGSGLPGMAGMQPRQQDIIRPLLAITHAQTLEYCRQYGITPIEDASNADLAYTRNRVRHQVLPLLESINPGFRAALLRSAGVIAVDLDFIESQVDAYWPQVVASAETTQGDATGACQAISLHVPALLALPLSLQRHLLRRVAEQICGGQSPLELRHFRLIENLLNLSADRRPRVMHLPHGLRVTRVLHTATFERVLPPEQVGGSDASTHASEARLCVPGEVMVPGTSWMARAELLPRDIMEQVRDALRREDWRTVWQLLPAGRSVVYVAGEQFCVRTRRAGDRMQPLGMSGEKKVQDILVDAHVARAERDSIPLFFAASGPQEGVCVWLAGVCLDQRARLTSETELVARLSIVKV